MFVPLFGFLFLFRSALTDSSVVELSDTQTSFSWKSTDDSSVTVQAADGYQIAVEASQIDLHGETGDYVSVKSLNEENEEGEGVMFTYLITDKPTYLYNSNKIQADYVGTNTSNIYEIKFTRVGEPILTTTEQPDTTTTEYVPTAAPEEPSTLVVFLYGRSAENYGDNEIQSLRDAIANMGIDYCKVQMCPLNRSISASFVEIAILKQCSMLWDNYDNCVNLTFALPIVKTNTSDDSLWSGYQLSTPHLSVMWQTYGEKYMQEIGLELYTVPDVDSLFRTRLIVIGCVVVGLVLLIITLRHVILRVTRRRRKLSDTVSIMNHPSNRTSQLSMTPHYLQELPPLFANDSPLYLEQRNHKTYSEYSGVNNSGFADVFDSPSIPSVIPTKLHISNRDDEDDADA